jgi:hypothetical protein
MFKLEVNDIGWWFWVITAVFLSLGVSGFPTGFFLAIGFTIFQLIYFAIKFKSITAFPIQVRFWYLVLLILSLPKALQWLFLVPTIGTWAQVLVGYCLMARCVSLFPWHREESFSIELFKKTIFSRPVCGSVKQGFVEESQNP